MLILTRTKNESIMIGDNIRIEIMDIKGGSIRIGVTAPVEIPVHRLEVYEAIKKEKKCQK
jgi:carbon storage regulator